MTVGLNNRTYMAFDPFIPARAAAFTKVSRAAHEKGSKRLEKKIQAA